LIVIGSKLKLKIVLIELLKPIRVLLVNHIQHIIDTANTRKVKSNIGLSASAIKNYNTFKKVILEY
jgi:hypothetical protein